MSKLIDGYGRKHDYLRVSVTDRCNLRCIYCMGPQGLKNIAHRDILSYEEILEVIRLSAEMGISKIRLTGGEPLVRKNLLYLIKEIAKIPAITDLSMTTNAILLPRYAAKLKDAGLQRVNISLDTLHPETFRKITRVGELSEALAGIEAALQHGLNPVKINTVLLNGYNHLEIPDFINLARDKNIHVRFIEYMRIGEHDDHYDSRYLPLSLVKEAAARAGIKLKPVRHPLGAGPAECFFISDNAKDGTINTNTNTNNTNTNTKGGTIGLIHSISHHFCNNCNRLRLTADGHLKSCLYWQEELNVRSALGSRENLSALFTAALNQKHRRHLMSHTAEDTRGSKMRSMSRTGG